MNLSDSFLRDGYEVIADDVYVVKCGELYFTNCAERWSPDQREAYRIDCVGVYTGRSSKEIAKDQAKACSEERPSRVVKLKRAS